MYSCTHIDDKPVHTAFTNACRYGLMSAFSTSILIINQAYSEYKHVLANILHSRYVARMTPVEARSPGHRSNVENAPRRRPVTGQPATPTSHIRRTSLRTPPPCHPPVTGQPRVQTPPSQPFALCRHIAGWTQACN